MIEAAPSKSFNASCWIDQQVSAGAKLVRRIAALAIGLPVLLLVPVLPVFVVPQTLVASGWYVPLFMMAASVCGMLAAGYLHAELFGGHWQRILCVVACYVIALATWFGLSSFNSLLFLGITVLGMLLGVAAVNWLDRRFGDQAEAAFKQAPALVRWSVQTARFGVVFLLSCFALSMYVLEMPWR